MDSLLFLENIFVCFIGKGWTWIQVFNEWNIYYRYVYRICPNLKYEITTEIGNYENMATEWWNKFIKMITFWSKEKKIKVKKQHLASYVNSLRLIIRSFEIFVQIKQVN